MTPNRKKALQYLFFAVVCAAAGFYALFAGGIDFLLAVGIAILGFLGFAVLFSKGFDLWMVGDGTVSGVGPETQE